MTISTEKSITALSRVTQFILKIEQQGSLSEADLDELHLLVDAYSKELPDRFNKIAYSFKHTITTNAQLEFIKRLRRVIEVSATLPSVEINLEFTTLYFPVSEISFSCALPFA